MSSTVTARFIKGQTLYLFPCLGCFVKLILAKGKSLIAGFLSCILFLDLNLKTASPSLNPFVSNIFSQRARFSLIFNFLHGQLTFLSTNFLKSSELQVHTYAESFFM